MFIHISLNLNAKCAIGILVVSVCRVMDTNDGMN